MKHLSRLGALTIAAVTLSAAGASSVLAQEILRPADASLSLDRLRLGTDSTRIVRFIGGTEQEGPLQIQTTERIRRDGEDMLKVTFTLEAGNGNLYDTAFARLPTFEPVTHRSRPDPGGPWRQLDLRFEASGVSGTITQPNAAPSPVDVPLEARVFDSALATVLFSVLPLASGYEVRVPFLDYTSMDVTYHTYRVVGESEIPFRGDMIDVWDMELGLPAGMTMRMKVAKDTRQVLRGEMDMGGGNRVVAAPPGA